MGDTNPVISIDGFDERSVKQFALILNQFFIAYTEKSPETNFEDWLIHELHNHLDNKSDADIKLLTSQIVQGVDFFSDNLQSLNSAIENGVSKEDWLIHNLKSIATQKNLEPHDFVIILLKSTTLCTTLIKPLLTHYNLTTAESLK